MKLSQSRWVARPTAEWAESSGAVEGEEAVEAQEAAGQVHEAAVKGADEAEAVAAEEPVEAEKSDAVSRPRRRWWRRRR